MRVTVSSQHVQKMQMAIAARGQKRVQFLIYYGLDSRPGKVRTHTIMRLMAKRPSDRVNFQGWSMVNRAVMDREKKMSESMAQRQRQTTSGYRTMSPR